MPGVDGRRDAWSSAAPMRAPFLAFLVVASAACTQSNTQLPPFYDAASQPGSDSGESDAAGDVTTPGVDGSAEAATDAAVADAPGEAASDGGAGAEGGSEAGPSDSGNGGG